MIKEYFAYLKDNPERYWFKRKLYGWGWTPATWQGWLSIFVFIVLMTLNAIRLDSSIETSDETVLYFIFETFILVSILIFIGYKTGEKPRWQWGPPKK